MQTMDKLNVQGLMKRGRVVQSLFRKEVLDAKAASVYGVVRLATPISHQLWSLVALGIAASIVVWLVVGKYTRREHVAGSLVPQAGLINVSAQAIGTISRIQASEGDVVRAGDPLLHLSGERSSASMGETASSVSIQLRLQLERLQADLINTQQLAERQASDLRMQRQMAQRQIQQLDQQIVVEQHEVDDLSSMLKRFESIAGKGFVSGLQVQQQRSQKVEAEQQVKTLGRQRVEAVQQLRSVEDQLTQLPLTTATKLDELHRQVAQSKQALAQNEAERETVVRAPEDGVISTVLVKTGQTATTGQALLTMTPKGSLLQAQLLVPSSAIGFVREGTDVVLHYQAFPYQKFGIQRGRVARISRNALTPAEITTLLGQQAPAEALYRVDVRLFRQEIEAYGRMEPLKPGMAVDADLLLDQRRMIEWILEPLYGMARRYGSGH
ncbi:HlyD family secretion protein [Burkholderia pseudomallei]|uniref:HlyD family secretion protein n=1 Tax=Burkholderia pseudomallei TaxID=28450 RepID=UPI001E4F93EE|nr:HlyD family efflux transporter periplasmic adaptor subunit [Burkholderia pseudomallei]